MTFTNDLTLTDAPPLYRSTKAQEQNSTNSIGKILFSKQRKVYYDKILRSKVINRPYTQSLKVIRGAATVDLGQYFQPVCAALSPGPFYPFRDRLCQIRVQKACDARQSRYMYALRLADSGSESLRGFPTWRTEATGHYTLDEPS